MLTVHSNALVFSARPATIAYEIFPALGARAPRPRACRHRRREAGLDDRSGAPAAGIEAHGGLDPAAFAALAARLSPSRAYQSRRDVSFCIRRSAPLDRPLVCLAIHRACSRPSRKSPAQVLDQGAAGRGSRSGATSRPRRRSTKRCTGVCRVRHLLDRSLPGENRCRTSCSASPTRLPGRLEPRSRRACGSRWPKTSTWGGGRTLRSAPSATSFRIISCRFCRSSRWSRRSRRRRIADAKLTFLKAVQPLGAEDVVRGAVRAIARRTAWRRSRTSDPSRRGCASEELALGGVPFAFGPKCLRSP